MEVREYLYRRHGIRVAVTTLAKWAVSGDGPPFQKDGKWPVYPLSSLDDWAERRLSPVGGSKSELADRHSPETA
jgi:hypothetical protein